MTLFLLSLGNRAPKGVWVINPAGTRKMHPCLCLMAVATCLRVTRDDCPCQLANTLLCPLFHRHKWPDDSHRQVPQDTSNSLWQKHSLLGIRISNLVELEGGTHEAWAPCMDHCFGLWGHAILPCGEWHPPCRCCPSVVSLLSCGSFLCRSVRPAV